MMHHGLIKALRGIIEESGVPKVVILEETRGLRPGDAIHLGDIVIPDFAAEGRHLIFDGVVTRKKVRKRLQHPLICAQREVCTRGCADGPAFLGNDVFKPFVGQILLSRTLGCPGVASLFLIRTRG